MVGRWGETLKAQASSWLVRGLHFLVLFYRASGAIWGPSSSCRFYPSCSEYALQALDRYGFWMASKLIFKRLISCHPMSKRSGFDPLPSEAPLDGRGNLR